MSNVMDADYTPTRNTNSKRPASALKPRPAKKAKRVDVLNEPDALLSNPKSVIYQEKTNLKVNL
jgi:hypothetical protein